MRADKSALDEDRKRQARAAIDEASPKLASGANPLDGLKPPPSCSSCGGSHGGTHHFLCLGRKYAPKSPEKGVRVAVFDLFRAAWRRHQYALQQVRLRRASLP